VCRYINILRRGNEKAKKKVFKNLCHLVYSFLTRNMTYSLAHTRHTTHTFHIILYYWENIDAVYTYIVFLLPLFSSIIAGHRLQKYNSMVMVYVTMRNMAGIKGYMILCKFGDPSIPPII